MVETATEKPEIVSAARPNPVLRSSSLKYYIHDGIDACRFQLLGELTEMDVPELRGCWRTAKTMLGKRKLILDLRGLKRMDGAGATWVTTMVAEGAECLAPVSDAESVNGPGKRKRLGKVLGILRVFRVPFQSSTQAR